VRLRSVTVVCHKYPPYATGGLAPYMERSLRAIAAAQPDLPVTLYTFDYPAGMPRDVHLNGGLRIRRLRMPQALQRRLLDPKADFARGGRVVFALALAVFNVKVVWQIGRRRGGDSDVVVVHDWQSTPAGILLGLLRRRVVVFHVHNTELTMVSDGVGYGGSWLIDACERLMARVARCVVVPTPEMRELLTGQGWKARHIAVVPHGFEAPAIDARRAMTPERRSASVTALRERLGLVPDDKVIVFVGRLSKVKGIHTLIEALPAIVDRYPRLRLVAVGAGFAGTGESRSVHDRAVRLGMAHHVIFHDRYVESVTVACHYDLADVCVFPSTFEPFGLVSVEAMSLGRPVVLGPGFSRTISHDAHGTANARVAKTATADELADLVLQVLDDPAGAQRMADEARNYVCGELTWQHCAGATLRIYETACGTDGTGPC
jgi:glycogen(starch) synthase